MTDEQKKPEEEKKRSEDEEAELVEDLDIPNEEDGEDVKGGYSGRRTSGGVPPAPSSVASM